MTKFHKLGKITTKLITSAGALALIAGTGIAMAPSAQAWDCLLDTNNDGDADSNVDTDSGADSGGINTRLACGDDATAGSEATALGGFASATGVNSTALGRSATAAGTASTALGAFSSAAGGNSTVLGVSASAAGDVSIALGVNANAAGSGSAALGHSSSAAGLSSTALGGSASTAGGNSTAVGNLANAAGLASTALGAGASAAGDTSTAVGRSASAAAFNSTALGYAVNIVGAAGDNSTALGALATARGLNAIAIGADTDDVDFVGADAQGNDSIVIGSEASDAGFDRVVVLGKGAAAIEADMVILKDASTFTILGNGNMGLGTAAPMGDLDINSGVDDTLLLLTNDIAQWAIKSNAANGKLTIGNNTTGTKPFKFGPDAIGNLLQVGIVATDQVDIKGDLVLVGTLTTGGPTCGGGCDAVFDVDYDLPSIEEHAAQMYANSYLPEIGPTVPHAPVNLSEQYGKVINELEKAHIYIAQQEKRLDQQSAELKLIKQQIANFINP